MKKYAIAPLALTLILSACSTTFNREPDWLANPKTIYPEKSHLVAVGAGDTRRAAENAAAANLSRIFEARIESDERLVDQTRETLNNIERVTDFTADINILSAQTLHNIQHAESWRDPTGRYHAVAYLDRRETARIYRDKIDQATTAIEHQLTQAGTATEPLVKYAQLRSAARQAAENRTLLRQLNVIHPLSGKASEPGYSENEIQDTLRNTAHSILVDIRIQNDPDQRITTCLEQLITTQGFRVGRPAALRIEGRIELTDTGKQAANLSFVRYNLNLHMIDQNDNTLIALAEKGREGHLTLTDAKQRAYRTLENAIKRNATRQMENYLNQLSSAH